MKTLLIVLLALFLALPNFAAERGIKRVQLSSLAPVETPYLSGKYRALVIGNNNYDDPEKLWPSLKTAVADAEAVAEILKTDYGFAEITLLKNTKQRDIVRAFNQLVTNAQENDSVLIYYAGHGYLNEDTKEGFWIPVDAEGRDDSTFVSNAIIKTKLSVIADKARHVLLVSDSCFSGALLREGNRGMSLDQKNERYYQKVAKKKSVQILAAGGLEFVDDNYKGAGHSPFTYYLLQSLKDNNVRYFEATDLSQETSRNVSVNTQQTPESGVLQGAGHAGGEFFFLRKKTAGAKVSTPSAPASKPIVSAPRKYRADEEMWELVKDSDDSEDLNIFLEEHPESPLAGVARLKLKRLERKQAKAKAEEQQQLAEEEKRLEEERKQLEAEKQKIAEAKRKAEPERKKQQELAALRQKQESESKQSAKSPAGTVTDTSTGLMWQKRTDGREYNWEDARRYCNDLQLGGYLDWVLPSKEVLADMRDKKDIFGPYNRVYYWSSTNYMSSSSHAWHVGLYNDKVSDLIKTSSSSVRCVRGGRQNQAAIGPKQESTPSGTVIDQATGLMWQKEPFDYHFNWYGAVEYCKNLDLGGFNDWTLPEKGDYPDEKSKILKGEDRIHDGRYEQFWTLTEAMGFGAWTADFSEMNPDVYETKDKLKEYSVRCVRGEKKILAFIPSKPESTEAQPETVIDQATGSWIEPVTGMKFLRIPGGTFMMGSPFSEKDRDGNETQHTMSVGKFLLAETEVTQAQWKTVMGSNPASFKGNNLPVENMSWNDAQKFIQKFNARTGKKFRLPTEAEWEYAARAGTTTAHYWGEGIGRNNANCSGCGSRWDRKQTAPVKSFAHNAFGLFDMLGNVYEWTCSEYKEYYDGNETKCTNQAGRYSLRGGSWSHLPKRVRASSRGRYFPSNSSSYGFRLAMDAP